MKIMKFGGTALATTSTREKCIRVMEHFLPEKIVVICSAMGRNGFPYATDTLRNLLDDSYIEKEEMDRIISFGEVLSSLIFTQDLRKKGWKTKSFSPREIGITTNRHFLDADVLQIEPTAILSALKDYDILVIPGFIGMTEEGEITTLGKGGSDLTATVLAEALHIQDVYLWKDVDGIYPYYPFATYGLHPYPILSYDEMLALCNLGYEVIQKKAICYAKLKKVFLHVGNYLTCKIGTIVSNQTEDKKMIGFSADYQSMQIVTFAPQEMSYSLQEILKKSHVFLKDFSCLEHQINVKVPSSQIPIVRKILIEQFFH